jgi:integrase
VTTKTDDKLQDRSPGAARPAKEPIKTMAQAKAKLEPGKYPVAGHLGLFLIVPEHGEPTFATRFRLAGKRHEISHGPISRTSLGDAIAKHRAALALRDQGINPIAERRQRKQDNLASVREAAAAAKEAAKTCTVADLLDAFLAAKGRSWKHRYAVVAWSSPVRIHALPMIGGKPVHDVTFQTVAAVLAATAAKGTADKRLAETTRRLRDRLIQMFDFALAHGLRDIALGNPAAERIIKSQTPRRRRKEQKHYRRLDLDAAPGALQAIHALARAGNPDAAAWTLMALTQVRPSVAVEAAKGEFDLNKALWRVPAIKMKTEEEFITPLSAPALALVKQWFDRSTGERLFPWRGGGLIPYATFARMPHRHGLNLGSAHSWRSVFADWCGDIANVDSELRELQLAHALPEVREAYRRGKGLEHRSRLLERYAAWLCGGQQHAVVPFPTAGLGG